MFLFLFLPFFFWSPELVSNLWNIIYYNDLVVFTKNHVIYIQNCLKYNQADVSKPNCKFFSCCFLINQLINCLTNQVIKKVPIGKLLTLQDKITRIQSILSIQIKTQIEEIICMKTIQQLHIYKHIQILLFAYHQLLNLTNYNSPHASDPYIRPQRTYIEKNQET